MKWILLILTTSCLMVTFNSSIAQNKSSSATASNDPTPTLSLSKEAQKINPELNTQLLKFKALTKIKSDNLVEFIYRRNATNACLIERFETGCVICCSNTLCQECDGISQ